MSLNGIDISGWQAGINLAAVPADFVIIKATGGTGFVSQGCDAQFQQAKALGKPRGIYHFAHEAGYQGSATSEANHFLTQTKGYHGEAMLVLDWEGDNVADVGWAKTWLDTVYAATGVRPVIYMNQAAENSYDWSPVVAADYALWIAQYPSSGAQGYGALSAPPHLVHWPSAALWQYTATGRLPGWNGALDLNIFTGDRAAWDAYTRKQGSTQPTPKELFTVAQYDEIQRQQGLTHSKLNNLAVAVNANARQNQIWHGQSHAKLNVLNEMVTQLAQKQGATFTQEEITQWAKEGAAAALAESVVTVDVNVNDKSQPEAQ
ncbi:GH25 family lysozyme [Psychromicrobium lacuslunae]|uniref:GH25 family lysozyme n=1 Tax=Psychromicrobium lacuslunae TaxID=1618207 RepID=UPI0006964893|nr:GH25 family lysozyme [Psychromicrobium lacuslunae]